MDNMLPQLEFQRIKKVKKKYMKIPHGTSFLFPPPLRQKACKTFHIKFKCYKTLSIFIKQEIWPKVIMVSSSGHGSSDLLHVRESLQSERV